jgi:hypothetical protein
MSNNVGRVGKSAIFKLSIKMQQQQNCNACDPESAKQPKQVLKMEVAVLKKLQGNSNISPPKKTLGGY